MKTRALGILGLVFLCGITALLLIPNVTQDFDTNPASLAKYLAVPIPTSAEVTHLAAMNSTANDGNSRHLQAVIKISHSDFLDLVMRLGLPQSDSGIISPLPSFASNDVARWWTPPGLDVQLKLPDRYSKHESTSTVEHALTMIWVDGISYLYESKFEGPINR